MPDPAGGREAEIEAVARALNDAPAGHPFDEDALREVARFAIAALDAVRSGSAVRNQEDEINQLANDLAEDWRKRAERAEAGVTMWKTRLVEETGRLRELLAAARSPQSEDHE